MPFEEILKIVDVDQRTQAMRYGDVREFLKHTKSALLDSKEVQVLKNLNLTVESGFMLSITGVSGVGKSTLLHILGTLDASTSGQVLYDGQVVFSSKATQMAEFRNRQIGFGRF